MASSPTGLKHDSNRYLNNIDRAKASQGEDRKKLIDAHDKDFYINGMTNGKPDGRVGDEITEETS